MTTADWALIISLISAGVSAAGFVWNVWSKFIHPKPYVDVSFNRMQVLRGGVGSGQYALCLSATNMGPGQVTLYAAVAGKRWRWQRRQSGMAMANPISNFPDQPYESAGPFSGVLPKKLEVGEQFDCYFPPDMALDAERTPYIGFVDTFRRFHLAKVSERIFKAK